MTSRKNHKLLFQIGIIFFAVLLIMTLVISVTVYKTSINGFLEAQNSNMEIMLEDSYNFVINSIFENTDEMSWCISKWSDDPGFVIPTPTDEERERYREMIRNTDGDAFGQLYLTLNDEQTRVYMNEKYTIMTTLFQTVISSKQYECIFLIDFSRPGRGTVLCEYKNGAEAKKPGEYYNTDMTEHPGIDELINDNSDRITYERSEDIPGNGNYYIAYKPVPLNTDKNVVMGIVYDWDEIYNTVRESLYIYLSISAGIIVLAIIILLTALYRLAIRPVRKLQNAIIAYTGDKNSAKIVAEMLGIRSRNELGYLADSIADLATEIDHYTNENIRISTEREKAEKELYEARVSVMVSQIQPHFMYNALSSIAMMCTIDPETAQEATVQFADYLRGNMDSLKVTAPVPFEQELEHLKKYLYIEKLRFAHKLNIVYNIGPTEFKVPLLSVQPLVENAVKHGVGMKKQGGTVTISTVEKESAYEIVISDDGVGFDVSESRDDGRSHVGMENTEKRLRDMCGAELIITSTPGEGTCVRIVLPKEEQNS